MKTPTHQATFGSQRDAAAWQFSHRVPVPYWVARTFHDISGKWCAIKGNSFVLAEDGDWAVLSVEENKVVVLRDVEFKNLFRPIPAPVES